MNEQDYELLSQYLDGELAAGESRDLRRRLIAEPQLRATLERMRMVDDRVRAAFDVPGADAVPARVAARLGGAGSGTQARFRPGWGLAIAASLMAAAGLLLAPEWRQATDGHPNGRPSADQLLAGVLERTPSRGEGWDVLADGRQVRPVLSFSGADGQWCREYLLADGRASYRGVACRFDGHWRTEVLAGAGAAESPDSYRPAGAADSDEVASYISAHAAGIPLSLEQEAEVIARRWQ